MQLYHKVACADCPWKKGSAKGWLGGYTPEFYSDAVYENEATACHNRDHGPDSDETAFCAGALGVAANSCISLWKSPGADEAKQLVERRDTLFGHVRLFYAYHAGKEYVMRILRKRASCG